MIWFNGSIVPREGACIDPADRGFLLADGLFETLLINNGHCVQLAEHLSRLDESAGVIDIPLPIDVPAIAEAIREIVAANDLGDGRAAVRLTLTRGPGGRGLPPPPEPKPNLLISATRIGPPTAEGLSAVIVPRFRRNEGSPLSNLKTLAYLDGVLALSEAMNAGHDEALLLNNAGKVTCASRANLFVRLGDRLRTPPLCDGVLPGVTRKYVIGVLQSLGHAVEESSIEPAELAEAGEAFISNSLLGILPLGRIGEQRLEEGEYCRIARAAYCDLIG